MTRLATLDRLPDTVARPGYRPERHGVGIVHLGLGAFHRAHQAACTDAALAAEGGAWRIAGVSLRGSDIAARLAPQNGLYTLLERGAEGTRARVIGAIARALEMPKDRGALLNALTAPSTRIVTVTVTEKGYGLDPATGGLDPDHPAIAADLANPRRPSGVVGLITWALGERRMSETAPFTVVSCDNLPENGRVLRRLVLDYAERTAPDLVDFIAEVVSFPSTMVDRITPASTPETLALAATMTGHDDAAAIETESFSQWVIEDDFPTGRPAWEAGGALFTDDVAPFEAMKLRMLNGTHSMLACAGGLAGHRFVRDTMADPALARLIRRHMDAAAATLAPLPGIDYAGYADALEQRFRNPHLAHETAQIATDGSQKLPQRLLAPAAEALARGQDIAPFAFAVAAWMAHATDLPEGSDPRAPEIAAALAGQSEPAGIAAALHALPGLFPEALRGSESWTAAVTTRLDQMLTGGMARAIAEEAGPEG